MTTEDNYASLCSIIATHQRPELVEPVNGFITKWKDQLVTAPGSTRKQYHHAYEGGLLRHILETYNIAYGMMSSVMERQGTDVSTSFCSEVHPDGAWASCLLNVALFHDIHKVLDPMGEPQYVANILKSGSRSDAVPYKVNPSYMAWEGSASTQLLSTADDGGCSALNWALSNGELTVKNGGIKSLMSLAAHAPDVLNNLCESELYAIKYHGGAYETSKFDLQGKENLLQIVFHAADMVSSRSASE